ncbi:hypothetical protein K1719_046722 [Acacia pycnantha]|nr:hypothetical protein K1719_046722 [Acacia pycnantha]
MSANDPSFILFGQKMSASQIPATSSSIPSNSPPEHDWSSSKQTEAGMPSTENSEQKQNEQQKNEATKISNAEEFKMMKKPDKIQQCPRCNNMDTKFCYFNNYNVNQPRHFCKSCHGYWTVGGAMRNLIRCRKTKEQETFSPLSVSPSCHVCF